MNNLNFDLLILSLVYDILYFRFIAMEQLRSGRDDGCLALITNHQVYFLRPGSASEDNIIFQAPYSKLKHCHTVQSSKLYKRLPYYF